MANRKIAAWNIYFSWEMVSKSNNRYRIRRTQSDRADNVGDIIKSMDVDAMGIVECMNAFLS